MSAMQAQALTSVIVLDSCERDRERILVNRALSGETSAFDQLFARHESALLSFLRRRLGREADSVIDEARQEVRIYVYRRLERYNSKYPFSTFVRGLAYNIIKRLVHCRRDLAFPMQTAIEDNDKNDTHEPSPDKLAQLPAFMRDVLGVDRFRAPGCWPRPSRLFLELFDILLKHGGYPHQQVAFAYSIMLWGRPRRQRSSESCMAFQGRASSDTRCRRKVPITGDPRRVVEKVGPLMLAAACREFMQRIESSLHLDPEFVARARFVLDQRLSMTCRELFARDATSLARHRGIVDQRVGWTRLADYFGSNPEKSVSDWTHAVKYRVRRAFTNRPSRVSTPPASARERSRATFPPS